MTMKKLEQLRFYSGSLPLSRSIILARRSPKISARRRERYRSFD
jgi:hypothetical protein